MKKLSFKNLDLKVDDLLQRKELKNIFGGGYGDQNCKIVCPTMVVQAPNGCTHTQAQNMCGGYCTCS